MLITIPKNWYEKCQSKKYNWGPASDKESINQYVRVGNCWEVATQLYLDVPEKKIVLRDGKAGPDSGIDLIIRGAKYQCKGCLLDGKKAFVLLDKTVNHNVDFYSLGKVYEDMRTCELVGIIRTTELLSLIELGKIVWHKKYEKWAYVLHQSKSWMLEQKKKNTILEGVIQNLPCLIYN